MLDEHVTKNTSTITVYRREEAATFTIFHSESEPHLCLDYLRLEPADPQLVKLIDSLIQYMSLSGEKHIIDESVRTSTFFNEGKVVNADHSNESIQIRTSANKGNHFWFYPFVIRSYD